MQLNKAQKGKHKFTIGNNQADSLTWTGAVHTRMTSVPSFAPQVPLVGQISEHFYLLKPLIVDLEANDDGSFAASDNVFYIYGAGANRKEALRDYIVSLSEYYELLSQHKDEPTVALFNYLQSYLQTISG